MPNPDGAVLWSGADVYYEKDDYTDYTSNQDKLTDFVWLTRQDERGLYNSIYENSYDNYDNGPVGTKWAFGSLSDYASLEYASWRTAIGARPVDMLDKPMVVHLVEENIYFQLTFLSWTSGGQGGGYSYVRTSPDGLEPDPNSINEYSYSFGDFEANMMEESRWELVITSDKPWESDFLNQQRERLNAEQAAGISQAHGRALIDVDTKQGRFFLNQDFEVSWTDNYTKQRSEETTDGIVTVEDVLSIDYLIDHQHVNLETPWVELLIDENNFHAYRYPDTATTIELGYHATYTVAGSDPVVESGMVTLKAFEHTQFLLTMSEYPESIRLGMGPRKFQSDQDVLLDLSHPDGLNWLIRTPRLETWYRYPWENPTYESGGQTDLPASLAFDDLAGMEKVLAQQMPDTDGDGASDNYENANGTDASDAASFPFLTTDKVSKYYYDIPEGALNITLEMEFAQQSDANIYSLVGSEDFFAIRLGNGDGHWDRFMDVIRTVNGEVFATDGMVHNVEPLSGELGHGKGVYSLKCIINGDQFKTIVDGNTIWKGQIISDRLNEIGYVAPTMVEVSLLEPAFLHTKPRITVDLNVDTPVEEWIGNGLVAYYPFDGNTMDVSGNDYHGITQAVNYAADRFGGEGSSYSVQQSSSVAIDQPLIDNEGNWTWSFWMKDDTTGPIQDGVHRFTSGSYYLHEQLSAGGDAGFYLVYNNNWEQTVSGDHNLHTAFDADNPSHFWKDSKWHHYTFTSSSEPLTVMYYDGWKSCVGPPVSN